MLIVIAEVFRQRDVFCEIAGNVLIEANRRDFCFVCSATTQPIEIGPE